MGTVTHAAIYRFFTSMLPPKANDVAFLYHMPWNQAYDFDTAPAERVVLSLTPTPKVYQAVDDRKDSATSSQSGNGSSGQDTGTGTTDSQESRPPHTIAFIHRPFSLQRHRVRSDHLILASHTSFDEHLTMGWNPALAQRLGLDMSRSLCVKGYKGDADRKIGILGHVSLHLGPLLQRIEQELGGIEESQEGGSEEIEVVAMMNAFSSDEVYRVLDMAQEHGWADPTDKSGQHVLYLTGEARASGLAAAKRCGMTVLCVGHRVAEQWGIAYLAGKLREAFPQLQVEEIYEDELSLDPELR
jgi:putative NIF3 family GTP cyclohydrolase 1 type 2